MGTKTNSGAALRLKWRIPAEQVHYHQGGTFYMPLNRFPAALCDPHGYLLVSTRADYLASPWFQIAARLNLSRPLCELPGYHRVH